MTGNKEPAAGGIPTAFQIINPATVSPPSGPNGPLNCFTCPTDVLFKIVQIQVHVAR